MKSAHLLRLFLLTWQLGNASLKNAAKGRPLPGGGVLASSQVRCQREPECWIPPWDSSKQSALLHALMDGPQPSPVPASYLALPLILSSSSGLNPLSLCHSTPLFLYFPSLSWAESHAHILNSKPRRMSTEQTQRDSVGQSPAINRLLEFIIVSSYDGEEPRGLGEREEGRPSGISLCWLLLPSLYRLQSPYQFHLSWFSSFVGRYLSRAGGADIHVFLAEWQNKEWMLHSTRDCTLEFYFGEQHDDSMVALTIHPSIMM